MEESEGLTYDDPHSSSDATIMAGRQSTRASIVIT